MINSFMYRYLKIQIEDIHDYENALEYIRNLGPFEVL